MTTPLREVELKFVAGKSDKFYRMTITRVAVGFEFARFWGRNGSKGDASSDIHQTLEAAGDALEAYRLSKIRKGYVEVLSKVDGHLLPQPPPPSLVKEGLQKMSEARRRRKEKAEAGELPDDAIFTTHEDTEAKTFNELATQRKEESEW